jgi:tetratricopeptide (TPR) repeat protein
LVADRLRADLDVDDLDGTEQRFRQLLAAETSDRRRAEILTQLAHVQGLRGDFFGGERLLRPFWPRTRRTWPPSSHRTGRGSSPGPRRGVELAESNGDARYWLGPLLNNLGWELFEAGEHEGALDAFQRALEAREQDPENRAAIEIARYAVAKTLRVLERPAEAAALLEQSVAWAEARLRQLAESTDADPSR